MSDINDGHYPTRAELHAQIDAHAKVNAKLLLRIAELEQSERESEALARAQQREVMSLREQVATLPQQLDAARVNSRETLVSMRKDIDALIVERDAAKAELATLQQTRVIEERETKAMVDAAKADAARLRDALGAIKKAFDILPTKTDGIMGLDWLHSPDTNEVARAFIDLMDCLAATDSAAWLEAKIAERTALHVEREKSLEQQLVAATNDAARAELRARDARNILSDAVVRGRLGQRTGSGHDDSCICPPCTVERACSILAASPDSDERLREVMVRYGEKTARAAMDGTGAHELSADECINLSRDDFSRLLDEVLGVKS